MDVAYFLFSTRKYWGPVLMALGLSGNLTSAVVVLRSKELKKLTIGIYMVVLAMVDSVFLCIVLLADILHSFSYNTSLETIGPYIWSFVSLFEPWVLVYISIERLIAVHWPLRFKEWCTQKKACIVLASLFTLSTFIVISRKIILTYLPIQYGEVYTIIFCALSGILPLSLLISLSVATIWKMIEMKRNNSTAQSLNVTQASVTLILVCVAFALLAAPYWFTWFIHYIDATACKYGYACGTVGDIAGLAYALSYVLYVHYTINFSIYSVTNSIFRGELKSMCFCCGQQRQQQALPVQNQQTEETPV